MSSFLYHAIPSSLSVQLPLLSLSVTDLNSCKVIAAWAPDLTPFNVAQVTDPISCQAT
jgi:hypothetical protein